MSIRADDGESQKRKLKLNRRVKRKLIMKINSEVFRSIEEAEHLVVELPTKNSVVARAFETATYTETAPLPNNLAQMAESLIKYLEGHGGHLETVRSNSAKFFHVDGRGWLTVWLMDETAYVSIFYHAVMGGAAVNVVQNGPERVNLYVDVDEFTGTYSMSQDIIRSILWELENGEYSVSSLKKLGHSSFKLIVIGG